MSIAMSHARIAPRDIRFKSDDALSKDWNGGDAFRTAFFNSMSILFPYGEKSFIDSVRAQAEKITDERLKQDIRGFMAQESIHRREHQRFNELLCSARGYDLDYLEKSIREDMKAVNGLDPLFWLATTVAYEHLTSTIAHCLLTQESWLRGADPSVAKIWRWHAIEEIEHKSVAFDVYFAVGGTRAQLRKVMLLMSWEFLGLYMFRNVVHMLGRNKTPLGVTLKSAASFLLGKHGLFRANWNSYWMFFARDFHPTRIDDRELLQRSIAAEQLALA